MTSAAQQAYLPAGLPAPAARAEAMDAPYWQGTKAHKLMVQVCAQCNTPAWPPEEICSACHSFDRDWVEAAGTGSIASWTRAWHPVHPALQGSGPYLIAVVQLSDFPSVRMVGNLLGDPLQEVQIGDPVRVAFEDHSSGDYTLAQWQRTG